MDRQELIKSVVEEVLEKSSYKRKQEVKKIAEGITNPRPTTMAGLDAVRVKTNAVGNLSHDIQGYETGRKATTKERMAAADAAADKLHRTTFNPGAGVRERVSRDHAQELQRKRDLNYWGEFVGGGPAGPLPGSKKSMFSDYINEMLEKTTASEQLDEADMTREKNAAGGSDSPAAVAAQRDAIRANKAKAEDTKTASMSYDEANVAMLMKSMPESMKEEFLKSMGADLDLEKARTKAQQDVGLEAMRKKYRPKEAKVGEIGSEEHRANSRRVGLIPDRSSVGRNSNPSFTNKMITELAEKNEKTNPDVARSLYNIAGRERRGLPGLPEKN